MAPKSTTKMNGIPDDRTDPPGDSTSTIDRQTVAGKRGHVSTRGASNLALPMPYLADFFTCLSDICHPIDNPQGHIPLAVAENKLATDLLQGRLSTIVTAQAGFGHSSMDVYSYGSPLGLDVMREATAKFFQERFLQEPSPPAEGDPLMIKPEHIAIGAGAICMLSNIVYALGNTGDAVLIPAPYYAAFDNDLRVYAKCVTIPVICKDPIKGPTPEDLQAAKVDAETKRGLNVRFLLLTNPHNPLGVIYEPQVMKDCITWARSHSMETIVDEIYALSVFDQSSSSSTPKKFESVLKLYQNDLGSNDDVHMIWGLSKDFGASGFRVGIVYTQNELLMESLSNLITFSWVSHPIQRMMADLLNDTSFCDKFLLESNLRLKNSYNICTTTFKECDIPFVPAQAGMFVYIDLSEFVKTVDEEMALNKLFMEKARMVFTPGTTQHDPKVGMYRICYAYVSPDILLIGMERFKKVINIVREYLHTEQDNDKGLFGDKKWIEDESYWKGILQLSGSTKRPTNNS